MDIAYSILRKDSRNEDHHKFRLYRTGTKNYRYETRDKAHYHKMYEEHIIIVIVPLE